MRRSSADVPNVKRDNAVLNGIISLNQDKIQADETEMLQLSCVVIVITLWFSLELVCKASITTPTDTIVPLPTNLKIHLYPGIINVTWDCNITKSMEEHTYLIGFPKGVEEIINISKCFHEHFVTDHLEFAIHKGLEITISSGNERIKEYFIPEGRNNTAAENLHCVVYNVSIINCSWTVGREAPNDTQYSLAFRQTQESQIPYPKQDQVYVPCDNYRTDSFKRQIGCSLKSTKLYFDVSVYVQLVGSSSETSIQFFDTLLKLDYLVVLDPPRNINLSYNSNGLDITWDTPETYSKRGSQFFIYSVNINGVEHIIEGQSYQTSSLHLNKKVNVSVRAKWKYWGNGKWSRWSEPLIIELDSSHSTQIHFLLILGIATFAILFLLIFLCHRFQVWKWLFPQIPKPAEKIFEIVEQNEFMDQNITKKSLPEEEDCICLQVTEVPLKEQPQTQLGNIGISPHCSNVYINVF